MTKDEALRLALEALKETWYHVGTFSPTDEAIELYDKAIRAIKEALETKDEPVAWMSEDEHTVYTSKQVDGCFQHDHIPLYTTPQRTWVGLTDEEIQECLQGLPTQTIDVYARRIETKIKDKND